MISRHNKFFMGFIESCQDAEKALINNAPEFKNVLEEIRKGQGNLRDFYTRQYEAAYGKASAEYLKNPYVGYYRMDAAYASQYQDRSTNPLIVFLKPNFRSEIEFVSYYGMSVENFLDQVRDGYIIPTISTASLYTGDFWDGFFKLWKNKLQRDDVLPTYSNLIEKIYARDAGVPESDIWKPFEAKLRQALPLIDRLNVEFGTANSRLPLQPALSYYGERFGRLGMLECKELSECLIEMLAKANVNDLNKHYQYLDLSRNFAFSTFHLYGSSIFYAKGGPVNATPSDIDTWKSAFEGVIGNYKNKKDKLAHIVSAVDEFSSHALGIQDSKLPFAYRQAKTRDEFEQAYYALNKRDDITDVRKEKTKIENEMLEKTVSSQSSGSTDFQNKVDKYLQVANQFFDTLQDTRLRTYRFAKNVFNLGATISTSILPLIPGAAPVAAGLKLIGNAAEYAESQEIKKMQKESLYLKYQPPFVIFQMEPPAFMQNK